MKLSEWHGLKHDEKQTKIMEVMWLGHCDKYQEIIDSMNYLDAVIARVVWLRAEKKFTLVINSGRVGFYHHVESTKYKHYGMKAIAEHLRWETDAQDSSKDYKVNNNLSADINHLLLTLFPELDGWLKARYRKNTKT